MLMLDGRMRIYENLPTSYKHQIRGVYAGRGRGGRVRVILLKYFFITPPPPQPTPQKLGLYSIHI